MRRVLISLAVLLTIDASAQIEHMEFRNIPISGNVESFLSKLGGTRIGETFLCITQNIPFAEGTATIDAYFTPLSNSVWKMDLYLGAFNNYRNAVKEYRHYRELYLTKFPDSQTHSEEGSIEKMSDEDIKCAIHGNSHMFYTIIYLPGKGSVEVHVKYDPRLDKFLTIAMYTDEEGMNIFKLEKEQVYKNIEAAKKEVDKRLINDL